MADGVIDSLSIEIGASSKGAEAELNKLAKALNKLKENVNGFKIGAFKKELGKLGNVEYSKIDRLAKALQGLKNISINSKLGENIANLAAGLDLLEDRYIERFHKLGMAMQSLNGVKVNIDSKLADNLFNVIAALDLMEAKHVENLQSFGDALQKLNGVKVNISSKFADSMSNIAKAANEITNEAIRKIERFANALKGLNGFDFRGFNQAFRSGFRGQNAQSSPLQNIIRQGAGLGRSQNVSDAEIASIFSRYREPGASGVGENGAGSTFNSNWTWSFKKNLDIIKQNWQPLIDQFKQLGQVINSHINPWIKLMASLIGAAAKAAAQLASTIAKGVFNAFKKVLNVVKNVAKSIAEFAKNAISKWWNNSVFKSIENAFNRLNKIVSSFGRVAFYRSVRTAIKYVTDALKEGTENAYWFAREFGNATNYIAQAYDNLASKNFQMSNQLGAAWASLIAAIEPIIIRIINLVTKAAEVVTQFFAILGGKTTYLRAVPYAKQWAESADDSASSARNAAEAVKEWKNQIMGFDEINRLDDQSDNGSNKNPISNLKNDIPDYENMFEEVRIDRWFSKLKDLFDSGDWASVGKMLGDKFNEIVTNFDWAGWGKKIGTYIQKGVDLAYNFLKSDGFRNLGRGIAELLDNVGSEINFNTLGRLFTRIRTALFDVLYGAVEYLGGNGGVAARNMAIRLSDVIIGAMQELTEWIASLDPVTVATAIREFFGGIKYGEIKSTFVTLVSTAWSKAIALKEELFPEGLIPTVTKAITDFFGGINWEEVKSAIVTGFDTIKNMFQTILDIIWPEEDREAFKENLGENLNTLVKKAVDVIDFAAIHNIINYKLGEAVFGKKFNDWYWNQGFYAGRDIIAGMSDGVIQTEDELRESLNSTTVVVDGWEFNINDAFGRVVDTSENAVADVKNAVENASIDTSGLVSDVRGTSVKVGSELASVDTSVNTTKQNIEGYAGVLKNSGKETATWKSDTETATSGVKSAFDTASAGITQDIKDVSAECTNNLSETTNWANGIKTELNSAQSDFRSFASAGNSQLRQVSSASSNMQRTFSANMRTMASNTNAAARSIVNSLNNVITAAKRAMNAVSSVSNVKVSVSTTNAKVKAYASGGLPEDGFFYANHSELVGRFANGRTAVANNEQITSGIASAVYSAFMQAFSQTGGSGGSGNHEIVLNVNGREFMRATYADQQAVAREKGISMIDNYYGIA